MGYRNLLADRSPLYVKQRREWLEIAIDWETRNQYQIFDEEKNELGVIVERARGFGDFLRRVILRSHRPLEVGIFDATGQPVLSFRRPFFFLFSDLTVHDAESKVIGHVKRRFGLLYKKYDLVDETDRVFARIASPRWRLWTFPISDESRGRTASIAKRWGGALREVFADADTFRVDFESADWSGPERALILAAAVSIDFDFFENNQGSSGLMDLLPS